jgi:four helix bundle protein
MTYALTDKFPKREIFGLTSQLRRCAVSVASNIAVGQGRRTRGEFIQFLGHARGSLLELETQIEIAFELHYVSDADHSELNRLSGDVLGLLNRLMDSMEIQQRETLKRETLK